MDIDQFNTLLETEEMVLLYLISPECSACYALQPKIEALLKDQFPKITYVEIDISASPVVTGQLRIFTAPAIILFIEGKESFRFVRAFSIYELTQKLERTSMLFS